MSIVLVNSYLLRTSIPIPASGLLSALDGSVDGSFFSDIAKTTLATEGGSVAVWADQSGNGNDWTQSNASYRPLAHLSANRLYNDGVQGGSASKHLVGPNISAWTTGSFFARVQNVNNNQGGIWGTTSWNDVSSANHWSYSGDNSSHYVCFGVNSRPSAFSWSSPSSLDLMTYEENVNSTGVVTIYVNGVSVYSVDLGTTGFRSAPYLGCVVRSNAPQYSGGFHFYRACMYNRIVTAEERLEINAWLASTS